MTQEGILTSGHLIDSAEQAKKTDVIGSTRLWGHLLFEDHPEVSHIILAYYHLTTRRKDDVRRFSTEELKQNHYFENGTYPPALSESPVSYQRMMCSISGIVGTTQVDHEE